MGSLKIIRPVNTGAIIKESSSGKEEKERQRPR
jgi:hypothetical protein